MNMIILPFTSLFRDSFHNPPQAASSNSMLGPLLEVVAESVIDSGLTFDLVSQLTTGFYLGITLCDTDYIKQGNADSNSDFSK